MNKYPKLEKWEEELNFIYVVMKDSQIFETSKGKYQLVLMHFSNVSEEAEDYGYRERMFGTINIDEIEEYPTSIRAFEPCTTIEEALKMRWAIDDDKFEEFNRELENELWEILQGLAEMGDEFPDDN